MVLLNFAQIRNNLENKNCKEGIKIVFYHQGKNENEIVVQKQNNKQYLNDAKAKGFAGEFFIADDVIFFSLGKIEECNSVNAAWQVQKQMGSLYTLLKNRFNSHKIEFDQHEHLKHCYYGFILASYDYNFLKKDPKIVSFNLIVKKEFKEIVEVAHFQNIARFLGDTPANLMTPTLFVEYATDLMKGNSNVEMKVLEEEECKKLGMNLFLSVGTGSVEKSKLLTLKFFNGNSDRHQLAMVGKGVCFDSGGTSLKPSLNMHKMKMDMMGAATIFCAFSTAVKLNLKINLTCTIPLVENMPGSRATKPGDVFVGMAGKSVEIGNTDAEGRLILGDALSYAQKMYGKLPENVIDAATLTGAMRVSLGNVYGGYFSNSDSLSKKINQATTESAEKLWRLPLSKHYQETLTSNVADFNNIGARGRGGSITAAEFLHHFIDENVNWAHFDIAGLMDEAVLKEIYGAEATGRPLPAFVELIKKLID
ncbi:Cytosol [Nucleospora cyclopteri]